MVEICDAILSAREGDRLEKKQLELACGDQKVRSMQLVRLEPWVCITDRVDRWVQLFPAEWSQMARLEGRSSPPQPRPLIWCPPVRAFVNDAVAPERVAARVVGPHRGDEDGGDMDEFDSASANVLMKHRLDVRLPLEPA
jgi:hypothetical protein